MINDYCFLFIHFWLCRLFIAAPGLSLVVVLGLLTVVAFIMEHKL